jgi:hypothetical protein
MIIRPGSYLIGTELSLTDLTGQDFSLFLLVLGLMIVGYLGVYLARRLIE